MRCCRVVLASLGLSASIVFAERPTLEHIYPTAVERGGTNTLTLSGKFESWPPKIWCSTPGLHFSFLTNKGQVELSVPAEAKTGPCLIRLFNDEGASDPKIFIISNTPHTADAEPNNHFARPQLLTNLPTSINGRLDKNNDVDSFGFVMRAGEWLDARLESHTLMSTIDAVLRLTTTNGYQLAWNHDYSSFDPRLVWRAPSDLDVVLQVFGFAYPAGSQIVLSGGKGAVYQLALTLSNKPPSALSPPLDEQEKISSLPIEIFGAICPAGDEDKFDIHLSKGEFLEARVIATEFGSDLDPWVKIEDADGKELARNDDAEGSSDAVLEWKAPADGNYHVVLGSVTHRGAEDWRYRLKLQKLQPDFEASIEANSFVLESTGTNELKVSTKRLRGFTNELTLSIESLPEGATAEPVKIDVKETEGTLKIVTKSADVFNAPIKLVVKDHVTDEQRPVRFNLVSRSQNNGVPGGYSELLVENTEDIWLTIKPANDTKETADAKSAE